MNSLFQYYFSVKPLRTAILNFEEHAEDDLTDEELKTKQISKLELERSKRCISLDTTNLVIAQLRILFQELITSDLAYIRPKEELIRLTLVDVKQEIQDEAQRRRESLTTTTSHSILDSKVPEYVEIEDVDIPPVPTSSPTVAAISPGDVPALETPVRATVSEMANVQINAEDTEYEFVEHESNDSGGVMSLTTSDPMSIDKENSPLSRTVKPATMRSPLHESQQINVMETELPDLDDDIPDLEDVDMVDVSNIATPPQTPPPIPHRPVKRRRSTWGVMKYGAQQDVTECITNCLSQMHAAFKPDDVAPNGDQIDLFKRYVLCPMAYKGSSIFA
jgi:ubiquitin carboxyl-terminal hydrolase 25/28